MAAQTGLRFEYLEHYRILACYLDDDATPDQWDRYLGLMLKLRDKPARFLVWVVSPPSRELQKQIADAVRGVDHLVALVSESLALRFVVSAFSLVNRSIRYFTPEQLTEAMVHIRCTFSEQAELRQAIERMQEP